VRVGAYELGEKLGEGASGAVYRARRDDGAWVALKRTHPRSPEDTRRLEREVEAARGLEHPNLVRILEVVPDTTGPAIVMELLPGGSLRDLLVRRGRLGEEEALALVEKLALGVQALHARGFVHRDLKPENVLFDAAGEPRICDFGIAKSFDRADSLTATGAIIGTPHYLAPEQAWGNIHEIGPRSDVWSLGVVLYECLAGEPPFQEPALLALLEKIVNAVPERPLPRGKRRDAADLALWAMEKDRDRRPASALAFAEACREVRTGAATRRRGVALPALAALLAATLAALILRPARPAPAPGEPPAPLASRTASDPLLEARDLLARRETARGLLVLAQAKGPRARELETLARSASALATALRGDDPAARVRAAETLRVQIARVADTELAPALTGALAPLDSYVLPSIVAIASMGKRGWRNDDRFAALSLALGEAPLRDPVAPVVAGLMVLAVEAGDRAAVRDELVAAGRAGVALLDADPRAGYALVGISLQLLREHDFPADEEELGWAGKALAREDAALAALGADDANWFDEVRRRLAAEVASCERRIGSRARDPAERRRHFEAGLASCRRALAFLDEKGASKTKLEERRLEAAVLLVALERFDEALEEARDTTFADAIRLEVVRRRDGPEKAVELAPGLVGGRRGDLVRTVYVRALADLGRLADARAALGQLRPARKPTVELVGLERATLEAELGDQ